MYKDGLIGFHLSGIFLLFILSMPSFSSEPVTETNKAYIKKAQVIFDRLASTYPSLNIAVVRNGTPVWTASSGYADINTNKLATVNTVYPLYSVAKGMTGILAAKLEEMGKLDIQKSVRFYLPDLPLHYQAVTVRHLIGHMAGIRHYKEPEDHTSEDYYAASSEWMKIAAKYCENPKDALPFFIDDGLIATPGEHREYSTFGYIILSAVLEQAGGLPFTTLMDNHIFKKSGATGAHLDSPVLPGEIRATLYQQDSGGFVAAPMIDNSCRFGGGGFVGRALDLALVGSAYARGQLIGNQAMIKVETPLIPSKEDSFTGYGFSVGITEINGEMVRMLSHGGAALGARSYVFIIVNSGLAVAIVGNLEGEHQYQQATTIAKIFGGLEI